MSKIILVVISYFIYFTQAKIVDDFRYVVLVHRANVNRAQEIEIKWQYQMYMC